MAAAERVVPETWRDEPLRRRARPSCSSFSDCSRTASASSPSWSTGENGKHVDEARGELRRGIEVVELAASMTTLMQGSRSTRSPAASTCQCTVYPLGVVTAITPFNFPG